MIPFTETLGLSRCAKEIVTAVASRRPPIINRHHPLPSPPLHDQEPNARCCIQRGCRIREFPSVILAFDHLCRPPVFQVGVPTPRYITAGSSEGGLPLAKGQSTPKLQLQFVELIQSSESLAYSAVTGGPTKERLSVFKGWTSYINSSYARSIHFRSTFPITIACPWTISTDLNA